MVNLGMILAAVLGLGGLLFLITAKKEGVSVGAEIGELGKGIGELGLGAGRGIAGAIGTPAFTLIEALRGIFQLGADIQGIPRRDDRAGARPGDEIRAGPAGLQQESLRRLSGFGVLEVGDLVEVIQESVDRGKQGIIQAINGGIHVQGSFPTFFSNVFERSPAGVREIEDRLGARAI